MKNILKERPSIEITPRMKFSLKWVGKDVKNKVVLDIGSGFGWFELNVLKKGVKEIIGIEISKEDLKASKSIKDTRAKFKVGSALKIPFKDEYFDTIVAWEVIEHIPKNSENAMFKEVRRVLKKGGVFCLSTPYSSCLAKYLDPAWWIIGHRHYSKETLIELGKNNKMQILEIKVKGRFWNLLNIINLYVSKWILRRKPLFETFFNNKESIEFQHDGFMDIFIKYKKNI